MRDRYLLPELDLGRQTTVRRRQSAIVSETGDSEWMTDDEDDEDGDATQ